MAQGFVYILKNPAHRDNHFKIGMTTRTVAERIKELSSGTGVPKPYEEVYSILFDDCAVAEKQMHQLLTVYRQGNDREFFEVDLWLAIKQLSELKINELRLKVVMQELKNLNFTKKNDEEEFALKLFEFWKLEESDKYDYIENLKRKYGTDEEKKEISDADEDTYETNRYHSFKYGGEHKIQDDLKYTRLKGRELREAEMMLNLFKSGLEENFREDFVEDIKWMIQYHEKVVKNLST